MKVAIALVTLMSVNAAYGEAPRADAPRTVLSTDLIDLARETFGIGIDHQVAAHVALHGSFGYDSRTFYDSERGWEERGGFRLAAGVRLSYLSLYDGPFVDAALQLRSFSTDAVCNFQVGDPGISTCDDGWRAWSPRLLVGWQVTLFSKLSAAAAVGAGVEVNLRNDGDDNATFQRTLLVASLRVGYAF